MGNRKFTRVGMSERASLTCGDHVFSGIVENASLRGLFIRTDHDIPLNIPVEVSVRHAAGATAYFDACVVRKTHNGLGLMIRRMNINSFAYLRDVVSDQCQCPDVMMHETKLMVGHILSS